MLIEEIPEETSEKCESREGDNEEDSVFSNDVSGCSRAVTRPWFVW